MFGENDGEGRVMLNVDVVCSSRPSDPTRHFEGRGGDHSVLLSALTYLAEAALGRRNVVDMYLILTLLGSCTTCWHVVATEMSGRECVCVCVCKVDVCQFFFDPGEQWTALFVKKKMVIAANGVWWWQVRTPPPLRLVCRHSTINGEVR